MNPANVQGFVVQNIPGQPLAVPSGIPHIFLNETAFNGGASGFSLPGVIAHELIHIGRPGFQPNNWFQEMFFHDLYGFSHHDRIIEACDCR